MAKKEFTVKAKFVFEGEFYIKAESKEQADEICDWNFNIHPQKIVQ